MATKQKKSVMVAGKPVDMDKLDEVTTLQATLLPANWPIAKREGVRLFLNLQDMLALQFQRHLAHNFKKIVATAYDLKEEGEAAHVKITFGVELDLSAPTVAAFAKPCMSFARQYKTTGKAQSFDIQQGDFLSGDGLSVVLDTGSLDAEMDPAPEPPEETTDGEAPKKKGRKGKKKAGGDVVELPPQ